jgi:hypothetical protein
MEVPVVRQANRDEIKTLLLRDHYITQETGRFRAQFCVGGFLSGECHAACVFAQPSSPEAVMGAFGLPKGQFNGIFELTRFCLSDVLRNDLANAGSWFMSRAIKLLKTNIATRAIITYADASLHDGGLYRASNFTYCGLTDQKRDFWFLNSDGTYSKHGRGALKGRAGEWRLRTRKHRYVLVYDKQLRLLWPTLSFKAVNDAA